MSVSGEVEIMFCIYGMIKVEKNLGNHMFENSDFKCKTNRFLESLFSYLLHFQDRHRPLFYICFNILHRVKAFLATVI